MAAGARNAALDVGHFYHGRGMFTGSVSLMMAVGPLLPRSMLGVVLIVVMFGCFYLLSTTLTIWRPRG